MARRHPKPKAPKRPSLEKYLKTDDVFKNSNNALTKNYNDYLTKYRNNNTNLTTDYTTTTNRLAETAKQQTRDLGDSYGSRGLVDSGLFGQAGTELSKQQQNEKTDADQSYARNQQGLNAEKDSTGIQYGINKDSARLAATRRYAQKYGVK